MGPKSSLRRGELSRATAWLPPPASVVVMAFGTRRVPRFPSNVSTPPCFLKYCPSRNPLDRKLPTKVTVPESAFNGPGVIGVRMKVWLPPACALSSIAMRCFFTVGPAVPAEMSASASAAPARLTTANRKLLANPSAAHVFLLDGCPGGHFPSGGYSPTGWTTTVASAGAGNSIAVRFSAVSGRNSKVS